MTMSEHIYVKIGDESVDRNALRGARVKDCAFLCYEYADSVAIDEGIVEIGDSSFACCKQLR